MKLQKIIYTHREKAYSKKMEIENLSGRISEKLGG
jgi:hypothetical protein